MPKVTIGMPTFNRAKLLKRAVEQVLSQSFQDFELIIYNDGSTDETATMVNSFNDNRITLINEINKGLPFALNKILELASGDYIIILHDHDNFNKALIEKSVKALDVNSEAGFVLQACAWINSDENSGYQEFRHNYPLINDGRKFGQDILSHPFDFSSPIHACCMVRKSAYEKVGKYYDEKFGWYCDVDLWFRLLIEYNFVYLNEVLFTFTGRERNHLLSKKTWEVNEWVYNIYKKHTQIFFNDILRLKKVYEILESKRRVAAKKTFIHSLFLNDKIYLQNSISKYSEYGNNSIAKRLILSIVSQNITQIILLKIGYQLNQIRKKIKK
jgi:glycosyltransferase involved in cell wall biosynthesis